MSDAEKVIYIHARLDTRPRPDPTPMSLNTRWIEGMVAMLEDQNQEDTDSILHAQGTSRE